MSKFMNQRVQILFRTYISIATIENVQWAIVFRSSQIITIIFHFHFDRISFIVFAAFEFLISIFFWQTVNGPFVFGWPIILNSANDNRFVWLLILFNKFFGTYVFDVNSFDAIDDMIIRNIKMCGVFQFCPRIGWM